MGFCFECSVFLSSCLMFVSAAQAKMTECILKLDPSTCCQPKKDWHACTPCLEKASRWFHESCLFGMVALVVESQSGRYFPLCNFPSSSLPRPSSSPFLPVPSSSRRAIRHPKITYAPDHTIFSHPLLSFLLFVSLLSLPSCLVHVLIAL